MIPLNRTLWTNYQSQFLASFFAEHSMPDHILVAQPGSGGTAVSIEIVRRSVVEYGANRVLVMVSTNAQAQYFLDALMAQGISITVVRVTAQYFRLLVEQVPIGENPWPSRGIFIVLTSTVLREEIRNSLIGVNWDLFVAALRVPSTKARASELSRLFQSLNAKRRFALQTHFFHDEWPFGFGNILVTDWQSTGSNAIGDFGNSSKVTIQIVDYTRNQSELRFLALVKQISQLFQDSETSRYQRRFLERSASSSLYNAEKVLRMIRNSLVHSNMTFQKYENDGIVQAEQPIDQEYLDLGEMQVRLSDFATSYELITTALAAIERVTKDAKYAALASMLRKLHRKVKPTRTIILTEFVDTASYLFSSLSEHQPDTYLVLPNNTIDENEAAYTGFRSTGGILIQTFTGEIAQLIANSLVLYDLPSIPLTVTQLLSQVSGSDTNEKPTIYALRDRSGVLDLENEAILMYKIES
jgi:hypothetical protein